MDEQQFIDVLTGPSPRLAVPGLPLVPEGGTGVLGDAAIAHPVGELVDQLVGLGVPLGIGHLRESGSVPIPTRSGRSIVGDRRQPLGPEALPRLDVAGRREPLVGNGDAGPPVLHRVEGDQRRTGVEPDADRLRAGS